MNMELTRQYLKIVQAAAATANYLHKDCGSWKKVSERVGGVSHHTWRLIAKGSPTSTPRLETLHKIAAATSNTGVPKKYDIYKDLDRLKQSSRRALRRLADRHGMAQLSEMLRVEPYKLHRWLSAGTIYIPEFRYLLAIDSLCFDI